MIMASHFRFDEEEEEYEVSNSEDEEKLKKYRNRKQEESDSEVEVLGVGSDNDSESDNQSDIALSDVEGQEEDDNLPDVRAWGKEKKKYYGADYVDPDYGGFQGKDAHAAEIEEEEAKNLQNQLIQQLDDNDFSLDVIFKKPDKEEVKQQSEEIIKTDLSKLTTKQKLQILQRESPEFFGLIEDFKVKITIAKDYLHPILKKVKDGKIEDCKAVDFVQTHYQLILNYAVNIYMYLLLKGNNKLKNHPIIQRLYQYRQLLSQIEPVFEEIIKPQIKLLLDETPVPKGPQYSNLVYNPKRKKTLKFLAELQKTENSKKTKVKSDSDQPKKKIKLDINKKQDRKIQKDTLESSSSEEESDMESGDDKVKQGDQGLEKSIEEAEEPGKRAITYQIAKNKGLTPHRKKELRNPRVKHKLKFRKALIRRKGAVREPRKELSRYSGEISGIKASVSKSIKIKS